MRFTILLHTVYSTLMIIGSLLIPVVQVKMHLPILITMVTLSILVGIGHFVNLRYPHKPWS